MDSYETGPAAEAPRPSFFKELTAVIKGGERDYTTGGMNRAIALLAIPMIIEMLGESVFAVVDVYFVSGLGEDAVSVIGLTETVLTLIFAVAIGLSMATTAMVARRIGEKREAAARNAALQAIILGLLVSLPIAILGIVFSREILVLMGAEPEVAALGATNVAIMIGGNATIILLFLINAVFRGAGNATTAMWILTIANLINIVLDPCLILGLGPFPEMGVAGAAIATTTGRGIGVLCQLYLLFTGKGTIRIDFHQLKIDWSVIARLIKVSFWGVFQWIIMTSSWIVLVRIVAMFGSAAIAGYTIGIRIIVFSIMPAWGLSNATATLVGQNLGADKPNRAARSVWLTGFYNMIFLGILALVFIAFAEQLVQIFTIDPEVVAIGADCLRFISYGYLFSAFAMVIIQAFNGAGDSFTPTMINFFCHWVFQIPLAYFLAHSLTMGPKGVFLSVALGDASVAIVGFFIFRRGKWKAKQI